MKVTDEIGRPFQKVYIPKNTAHTEFVLIFQITAVAPFQNKNSKDICSLSKRRCNIKFTCGVRYLAVSDVMTVQPHIKTGINPFKIQVCPGSKNVFAIIESMHISTAGYVMWKIGRIKGKGVAYVRILM